MNRPPVEEIEADPPRSSAYVPEWAATFTRRMFDDGWLVPGWPPERGGRNAGAIETLVYLEELNKAGVPRTTNPQGLGIIAPSLFDYGTDEQIERYAMPLLRGETSACLGMSEPDAGSDLANLKTRAVRDGDSFIINGQKVWTSGANYADFCFLFCRTDPDLPKHKGISIMLLPMDTPGVTVKRMLLGQVSGKNVGGIISIGVVSYSWASLGITKLLFFLCMLSLNLAFLNVLPIPILDGGHLMFLIIEKIKGSPVSERVFGYSQMVGIVLIVSLMIYVTYNDLVRWVFTPLGG